MIYVSFVYLENSCIEVGSVGNLNKATE